MAPIADVGVGDAWAARDAQGAESRVTLLGGASAAQAESLGALLGTLRALSNPGIVATVDAGVADGRAWAASERFDGRSLANWIEGHRQAGTRPGFGVVQRVFDRVASALQAAHAAGVVHGALSARCVVLKRLGAGQHHARLVDFALGPYTLNANTSPTWFDYQAPEQRGPRADDAPATDVFAAAVLLAEMLTLSAGPRPDARETWAQFAREAKAPGVTERLVALRNDVPRGVWEVVAATLAGSPRERAAGVLRLQRAVREAWSAAGEWDRTGHSEPDPPAPDPSRVRVAQAPAPQRGRSATAIEGWQSAERAQAVTTPLRGPTAIAGTPVAPAWVPQAPASAPAAPYAAPAIEDEPVYEATEAIDLEAAARYLQQLHGAPTTPPPAPPAPSHELPFGAFEPDARDVRESTQAIDAEAFFAARALADAALDDEGGTAVRAQGSDIAAAIAAAAASAPARDESTRMLDVHSPESAYDPRPSFTPWTPGSDVNGVPDPYGGGAAFGVDDPFGGSVNSMPPPAPQERTQAWSVPEPAVGPTPSPFVATLKAVPRGSIPTPPAAAPPPSPQKLWGAAPPASARPSAAPVKRGPAPWQWGLLAALALGLAAAVFLVLRAR